MPQADDTYTVADQVPPTGYFDRISPIVFGSTIIAYDRIAGYERVNPRKFVAPRKPIPVHHPLLGDYIELVDRDPSVDVEAEQCTWPELVDQTRLAGWCGRYDFDDAEDEDFDLCITDCPHDAREEDGI